VLWVLYGQVLLVKFVIVKRNKTQRATWIAVAEQTYQESVGLEERQSWQREKNAHMARICQQLTNNIKSMIETRY
jgi:hypothetical protein